MPRPAGVVRVTAGLATVFNDAADFVAERGLDSQSVFDAIATAAGDRPGEILTDDAFNATRAFARWLGYDANDELSVAQALTEWMNRPEQTVKNVVLQLRRAAVQHAGVAW